MSNARIAELEAEIAKIRKEEEDERKAARESVTVEWEYTMVPRERNDSFDKILDPSVIRYRLEGRITNREEAEAVGHHIDDGGMDYFFNTLSGKIIMASGGGRIFVSEPWSAREERPVSFTDTIAALSDFLVKHPEGGDVTAIVKAHRGE